MNNIYSIYKLTFPNGKVYIGQTKLQPEQRWKNGKGYKGQAVYIPIITYGWDNVKKEILHENLTAEQANELETHYIKVFNARINGYNQDDGGGASVNQFQKTMWIDRHDPGAINYIKIGNLDFFSAYNRLTYVGVGVYMYICCQVPNSYDGKKNDKNNRPRPFELSPQAISNFTGMPRSSAQKGIQNLVENGYIYCIDSEANLYQFIDILPEDRGQTLEEHELVKQYSLEDSLSQLNQKRDDQLHELAKKYKENL